MRALNTITKNHRLCTDINKSHFCTDMKEQITLLHGYEKRDRSRVGIIIEKTRDDLPKNKRQKSRKTRTAHGAYTEVREYDAHSLTKKKARQNAVL